MFAHHQHVSISRGGVSRRSFLKGVAGTGVAAGALGFYDIADAYAKELKKQGRSMILLWMQGGPSQMETFDPKPGTENGGPTKAIKTAVGGIEIAQGWNTVASQMKDIALIRSMTNREGNHQRAQYQLHTGYQPSGSVKHPSFGSAIAKQLSPESLDLPSVVSIGRGAPGAGFLGVDYEPYVVAQAGRMPDNLGKQVDTNRFNRRLGLLGKLEQEYSDRGGKTVVENHKRIYKKASKMVLSPDAKVFDLTQEKSSLLAKYGRNPFGQGCLLARRLVEAGTSFVEVRSGNWDTHQDNFERTTANAKQVDPGFGTLIADLKDRGMLERTVVVWMGEFGRTPRINPRTGRDHYPRAFNAAIAGGGIKGGQVIGATTANGTAIKDRPVQVGDLFASICKAIKVDPDHENISPLGRPMRIVDKGKVIKELF